MKLLKLNYLIGALAILLSSCGSISITQKRYSNGLNITWFQGKDEPRATPKKRTSKPAPAVAVATTETSVAEAPVAESPVADINISEATEKAEFRTMAEIPANIKATNITQKSAVNAPANLTEKQQKRIEKRLNKVNALLKPLKVQQTDDGGGALRSIGWVLIIIGLIFLLIISILLGALLMLLGLLFVVAGK